MNIIQSDIKTMSSREIAELTGKEHSNVKRDISAMVLQLNYPDKLLKDCPIFNPSELKSHSIELSSFNHAGNLYDEFLLDEEYSLLLVSGYKVSLRLNIIKRWKELESQQAPAIPQTYAAALLEAGRLAQITADQAEQLAIAAPKVEFHDTVVNSTNTFSTRDAAKKISQRPIKFGEWLKSNGYICLNGRAAQKYIDMGLFVTHTGVSDSKHSYTQTRMTIKGCAYFANKLFEIKL